MNKLLGTATLLLGSSLALAAGLGLNATSSKTAAPVAIDAKMEDGYKTSSPQAFSSKNSGVVTDEKDLSGKFMTMYDADALYVFVDVTDDKVDTTRSESPWDDDSVEIYVDGGNEKAAAYDDNDTQFVFSVNKKAFASKKERLEDVEIKFETRDGGYSFEARLPWKSLGVSGVAAGKKLGLEVELNDDDDGAERDGKLSWNADKDECWQNPSYFGTLELK